MKELLVLRDPGNPLVPVDSVIAALRGVKGIHVTEVTFDQLGHPTLPNGAFALARLPRMRAPDAIFWVEGGPLPGDLAQYPCPKAAWLVNSHLEPTLLRDLAPQFDRVFSASLKDTATEQVSWLPLSAGTQLTASPEGLSLLLDDPKPPRHAEIAQGLRRLAAEMADITEPIVVCLGNGERVHPQFFEALRSGAAVVCDSESDLRGLANSGEHLERFGSAEDLGELIGVLSRDPARVRSLAERGTAIVEHLHLPAMRADRIVKGLWPEHRVLSGQTFRPRVSILVTCHRYLKRFKVCLESLARQDLPDGALEVVVADPESPDGLADHLESFAAAHPGLRLVHLRMDSRYYRNRGVGINRAFDVSAGQVVIGIDGDLVFPPHLVGVLEEQVLRDPAFVYGVRRSFIGRTQTEEILKGSLDPLSRFEDLSRSEGDGEAHPFIGVLGYCQAVHRAAFAQARYPEEFDKVNQSDILFVDRLREVAGINPRFLEDLVVLHLWHPRNWSGAQESL